MTLCPDRDKRVLWLINHSTLREFEVPLLTELGFEVFCPKRFPRNADNRSASISYEFDSTLTIAPDELETLNQFDFYNSRFTPEIRRIINSRFGTAIVAYMFPMLDNVCSHFRGRILLRAFGVTHPTYTYYSFAKEVAAAGFERRMARVSERFWFAQAYPNLKSIEPRFIQERSVDLPLGLPDRLVKDRDTWRGGSHKILFICPEIRTYDENRDTYKKFKKYFGTMPHAICGAQSKAVTDDPSVLGKVDADAYARLFRECNVMFYHSELPRHLHYHPLEAVCFGMPLVYMQKGMLGQLVPHKLPGACDTFEEAVSKVKRLIDGRDESFAREVRHAQQEIYHLFTREYGLERWREGFAQQVVASPVRPRETSIRVAVLVLDDSQRSLKNATDAANQIVAAAEAAAESVECRVGFLAGSPPESVQALYSTSHSVSAFDWVTMPADNVRFVQRLAGNGAAVDFPAYQSPSDQISDFMECDCWLLVGDYAATPVAPIKPFCVLLSEEFEAGEKCSDQSPELSSQLTATGLPRNALETNTKASGDEKEEHRAPTWYAFARTLQQSLGVFVPSQRVRALVRQELAVGDAWLIDSGCAATSGSANGTSGSANGSVPSMPGDAMWRAIKEMI